MDTANAALRENEAREGEASRLLGLSYVVFWLYGYFVQ